MAEELEKLVTLRWIHDRIGGKSYRYLTYQVKDGRIDLKPLPRKSKNEMMRFKLSDVLAAFPDLRKD